MFRSHLFAAPFLALLGSSSVARADETVTLAIPNVQ